MLTKSSDLTRQKLLLAAYEEIHRYGFQAASLARILAKTNLTKGALYHHFKNKIELGYAVVDELIQQEKVARWITPFKHCENPLTCMIELLHEAATCMDQEEACLGCALQNLAQEMSPVDEGFRLRIHGIYQAWQQDLSAALVRGQTQGVVRHNIDPNAAAIFIVASMQGCIALTKQAQDIAVLHQCGKGLVEYLQSLRA